MGEQTEEGGEKETGLSCVAGGVFSGGGDAKGILEFRGGLLLIVVVSSRQVMHARRSTPLPSSHAHTHSVCETVGRKRKNNRGVT